MGHVPEYPSKLAELEGLARELRDASSLKQFGQVLREKQPEKFWSAVVKELRDGIVEKFHGLRNFVHQLPPEDLALIGRQTPKVTAGEAFEGKYDVAAKYAAVCKEITGSDSSAVTPYINDIAQCQLDARNVFEKIILLKATRDN